MQEQLPRRHLSSIFSSEHPRVAFSSSRSLRLVWEYIESHDAAWGRINPHCNPTATHKAASSVTITPKPLADRRARGRVKSTDKCQFRSRGDRVDLIIVEQDGFRGGISYLWVWGRLPFRASRQR
jgi:hypothetical protein